MRIEQHPILDFSQRNTLTFLYNGRQIKALASDTVASALYASGVYKFKESVVLKRPRGFFCAIGNCSSCAMEVDGVTNVRTCITPVRPGMVVNTQEPYPQPSTIKREAPQPQEVACDIAVIGGGPAGLKAALGAAEQGASVVLIDENYMLGGQLIKQTHKFFGSVDYYANVRGVKIGELLIEKINAHPNIKVLLNSTAVGFCEGKRLQISAYHGKQLINVRYQKAVVACGAGEAMLNVENNDLPGVYGAGAVQTLVNVYGVPVGQRVLVIGAGNVGLILAYHLIQAGISVAGVVEAMPKVGGFQVHANKILRRGVKIHLSHGLVRILGSDRVSGAVIAQLGKDGKPVAGTEKELQVDTVALAVGLQPNYRLCYQAGCAFSFVPELSGYVPRRNRQMQTSLEDIYIAGDCTGIEEATTAMMEGEVAGLAAAGSLGMENDASLARREELQALMREFRQTGKGLLIQKGIERVSV